ncbi:MAG: type II toxin-antitoxin system YafQ family toxin [Lachnospiraceae bacterium]|nr:type II toxin-antitoxin system YafQ family toxin [Lachnospiraceae bacterium]
MKKQGKDMSLLESVIDDLLDEKVLDEKYQDHPLVGNYIGFRECHIQPDWLLIYAIDNDQLILTASRTGSHSDLFSL